MELRHALHQIKHMKATKRVLYGTGPGGWIRFLYYGLVRINRFVVLKADLQKELPAKVPIDGATFEYPAITEIARIRSGRELPREFHCDQFQKVHQCCVGKLKGELAYIHWIYRKGDFSRFLQIASDTTAEINYVMTLPEFRKHGLSSAGLLDSLWALQEQGLRSVFAVVHEENVASLKSFRRAGFIDCTTIHSVGPFNRKIAV